MVQSLSSLRDPISKKKKKGLESVGPEFKPQDQKKKRKEKKRKK
jgi:hypothetical protein